ncbi:RHS repeat-associated core domain-containing protein [Mesorhizobium sp. AD1-1]|nr:RHS repeat-associated core domain-containing protein [Mesorhizobium sp. AD1-1]MBZ9722297.1 RHS repeat-associated core domain-containing protein [Mesorhizobium sp. AD1-1]
MTDQGRNVVWQASYLPFGEVRSISGTATLNQRFPGQWFQMETGLAYNWHRHYDASIGRYLQPDPLGMPNGPSRWAYVGNSPLMKVDPSGLYWVPGPGGNRWWCWGGNPLDCVLRPPPQPGPQSCPMSSERRTTPPPPPPAGPPDDDPCEEQLAADEAQCQLLSSGVVAGAQPKLVEIGMQLVWQ